MKGKPQLSSKQQLKLLYDNNIAKNFSIWFTIESWKLFLINTLLAEDVYIRPCIFDSASFIDKIMKEASMFLKEDKISYKIYKSHRKVWIYTGENRLLGSISAFKQIDSIEKNVLITRFFIRTC